MKGSTKLFLAIGIILFVYGTRNAIGHWGHFVLTFGNDKIPDIKCWVVLGYLSSMLIYLVLHGVALYTDYLKNDLNFGEYTSQMSMGPFLIFPIIIKLADKYL